MFRNISKKPRKYINFIHILTLLAAFAALSACVKNTELVGYTFKSEKIDQIKPGQTSQSYVKNTLGTPSVIANYGGSIWYYISTEYETIAFLKPKIKSQKVIAITFGDNDMVTDIKEFTASDARDIKMISDITKSEGSDVGLLGQLLGNVGRFNSEPGKPKIGKPRSIPK